LPKADGSATLSTTKRASSSSRATSAFAQGYGGQVERAPVSLEKLSIQDDIVTYTTKDGAAHEFDPLEFLAQLSCHIPKTYESITRYYGRYSCRRRGERAKLSPPPPEEQESDYRREFCRSGWAACIKRIYEVDPLECPKCKAQMRIIAFIQDAHSIKDIMKMDSKINSLFASS
jgi:hypothetical protein